MAGFLEKRGQDMPEPAIVVDQENALCSKGLRHRRHAGAENQNPAYLA